ncbi:MAG: MauE/DoxX family redox-associated membrane protein, partial [Phycisphaerae bacterium]
MSHQNPSLLKPILAHLCALAVAGFFLYAAFDKIGPKNTRQFALDVKNYKILDASYVNIPAIFLPWCEAGAALALLIPNTRRAGAFLITVFLIV